MNFGKAEMETAAEKIVQQAIQKGTWNISLSAIDFLNDYDALRGFECLIGYQWLDFRQMGDPDGDSCQEDYTTTPHFIQRVFATSEQTDNLPPLNKKEHTMLVWTEAYTPFIMGGDVNAPIATEVETGEPIHLDHGITVYLVPSPKGEIYIAESTTGAFVGTSLEEVKKDIATADPQEMQQQLAKAKERVKKATILDKEKFWARFR